MKRGFTLIELTIVLTVIAIIAVIAIPNVVTAQLTANERSASVTLRVAATVEYDFRSNDRDGNRIADFWTGDLSGLYRIQNVAGDMIRLVERPVAQMDGSPIPAGGAGGFMGDLIPPSANKAGYWVMAMDEDQSAEPDAPYRMTTDAVMGEVHNGIRFGFIAYPEAYGVSGRNLFITNESGVIYRWDAGGDVIAPGAPPLPIAPVWLNYPNNPTGNGWGRLD